MSSPESTTPGGDLTEHGADPQARDDETPAPSAHHEPRSAPGGDLTEHGADAAAHARTSSEEPSDDPGGDLTEHGADPSER